MKKATIASIVLALLVAANAAAATNRVPIMKRKGGRKGALNELFKKKRDPSYCSAVTCIAEGETCSDEDDTELCNDDMSCINGKCGVFIEGGPCDEYGSCYNILLGEELYCNYTENKCHKQKGEGEACTMYGNECGSNFFCNAKDSETPGVCVKYPTKAGDECFDYYQCPTGTTCRNFICTEPPTTVGAECSYYFPCVGDNLTCNSADNKCVALPSEGEACPGGICAAGLYCNDTDSKCAAYSGIGEECSGGLMCGVDNYCNDEGKCAKLPVAGEECLSDYPYCEDGYGCNESTSKCFEYPGVGEECYDYYYCGRGLRCTDDYDTGKRICRSTDGNEGSICNYDTPCNKGFVCDYRRNKCFEGECRDDDECPAGKGCSGFKCVDFMSVEDGGECNDYDGFGVFVCKEGSACVPNSTSITGYRCMKITTTFEDPIPCTEYDDPNCPADTYCECNAITGTAQCIPYTTNNKDLLGYYKKYLALEDSDGQEAYLYDAYINNKLSPYDQYTYCTTIDPLPPSSGPSSSSSVPTSSSSSSSEPISSSSASSESLPPKSASSESLPPKSASSEPIHPSSSSSEPISIHASSGLIPAGSSDRKPLAFSLVLFLIGLIKAFF